MKKSALALILGFSLLAVFSSGIAFADETEIMEKLKTISDKQDQILAQLESIKTELNIVKVRATING